MNNEPSIPGIPEPLPPGPLSARVAGIGTAGIRALRHTRAGYLRALPHIAIHTDARALADAAADETRLLGAGLLHGLGTGGDPALGKAAAEEDAAAFKQLSEGANLLFLITGLGGGTGSGAAPILARAAKEAGALVLAIAALPFEFEGSRRQKQAQWSLQMLRSAADAVICLPNQRVFQFINDHTTVVQAFDTANALLAQGIAGVWQMLTRPGLIQVDFADLCSVVRGRHAESSFGVATAEGEHRAREVIDRLLQNPFLQEGKALAEAETVLVSLVGGPDLTMKEVDRVMEQLGRHTESAQLRMGAAVDASFEGRLEVTVITSKRGQKEEKPQSSDPAQESAPASLELDTEFLSPTPGLRPPSRYVPPAPELAPDKAQELFGRQRGGRRSKKALNLMLQPQLPLEIVSKGRFEKIEPTIHRGEDLDVPTFIRRGIPLN